MQSVLIIIFFWNSDFLISHEEILVKLKMIISSCIALILHLLRAIPVCVRPDCIVCGFLRFNPYLLCSY